MAATVHEAALGALSVLAASGSSAGSGRMGSDMAADSSWPTVVLVDAGAAQLVRAVGGAMTLVKLLRCSSVAPIDSSAPDVLCMDLGGPKLLIVLLASPIADSLASLVTVLKRTPRKCEVKIASWFAVSPADLSQLEARSGLTPLTFVRVALNITPGPHHACEFLVASGACPSPTLARLGLPRTSMRPSVADLDPDEDLSPQYKARLKATALALDGALSSLGLDVTGAIYALGVGARLVANTLHASSSTKASRPAALLVVDRALDWASPLDFAADPALASLARLHQQLVASDQGDEVLRQLADGATKGGSVPRKEALLLALKAASAGGAACAFSPDAVKDFARAFGEHNARVVVDASLARQESGAPWAGPMDGTLVGQLVRAARFDTGLPLDFLHHAGASALNHMAKAGFGLLSRFGVSVDSVGGGEEDALRERAVMVVFVLGGVCSLDVTEAVAVASASGSAVFVGGTSVADKEVIFDDAFGLAKDLANVFTMG